MANAKKSCESCLLVFNLTFSLVVMERVLLHVIKKAFRWQRERGNKFVAQCSLQLFADFSLNFS